MDYLNGGQGEQVSRKRLQHGTRFSDVSDYSKYKDLYVSFN
jgi:hypothetical protein